MSRFDSIAESASIETDPDAVPLKRLSVEEEFLTRLLSKVIATPCQKKLFSDKSDVMMTCLEDVKSASSMLLGVFQGKEYNVNLCVVCFVKKELDKIANPETEEKKN